MTAPVTNLHLMGDTIAAAGVLADIGTTIRRFVDVFVSVYILLVLAYVILSWFRMPYSPVLSRIQRFLYDVVDPYLRIFRRFIPPIGGALDISPIVAVLVLVLAQQFLGSLIDSVL